MVLTIFMLTLYAIQNGSPFHQNGSSKATGFEILLELLEKYLNLILVFKNACKALERSEFW